MVNNITDWGKNVKIRLTELGKTQNWLIEEVKKRTGLYFDGSYLHRMLTGKEKSPTIIRTIDEILESES